MWECVCVCVCLRRSQHSETRRQREGRTRCGKVKLTDQQTRKCARISRSGRQLTPSHERWTTIDDTVEKKKQKRPEGVWENRVKTNFA
jgi:hypothetical protein